MKRKPSKKTLILAAVAVAALIAKFAGVPGADAIGAIVRDAALAIFEASVIPDAPPPDGLPDGSFLNIPTLPGATEAPEHRPDGPTVVAASASFFGQGAPALSLGGSHFFENPREEAGGGADGFAAVTPARRGFAFGEGC